MAPTTEELTKEIAHLETQLKSNREEVEAIREMKGDVDTLVDKLTRTQAAGQILERRLTKAKDTLRNRKVKAIEARARKVQEDLQRTEAKKVAATEKARSTLVELYNENVATMVMSPGGRVPVMKDCNDMCRESNPEKELQAAIDDLERELQNIEAERRAATK